MKCRHCKTNLTHTFLDLGSAPPSNAYLTSEGLKKPELWLPLRILVCDRCWLVQTEDYTSREILFSKEYSYFSSFSKTWLSHAKKYVDHVIERLSLNDQTCVVEIASNDGYLLQYMQAAGIPNYGIEPTEKAAIAAEQKGIETIRRFFGLAIAKELASEGRCADLMIANNVLAHVPDINDFLAGFVILLKPNGVATFEFPHLLNMMRGNQFDTAYHEHYSYLSLTAIETIFFEAGLRIFDVDKIDTHGGSLRVYAQKTSTAGRDVTDSVAEILREEEEFGIKTLTAYANMQRRAESIKDGFVQFLIESKRRGKTVIGYGAAAKGNTLINYSGIKKDLISFVIDLNPEKQGKYLPGSRIPIFAEEQLKRHRPHYVLILPWNLKSEVIEQLAYISDWNGQFVTVIPKLEII